MIIPLVIEATFVLALIFAAWSDVRRFLIPNIYPAILILLFVAAKLTGFGFVAPFWQHLVHFVVALLAGMLLFHVRWIGGGDAKLYAAVALWFSIEDAVLLLFLTTAAGGGIVLFRMMLHFVRISFRSEAHAGKTKFFERKIAYGIAIAAGGIIALVTTYPPPIDALQALESPFATKY